MTDTWIQLGGGPSIGSISVDESLIRGEGGPGLPQLVVPVKITLHSQSADQMLAVVQMRASLHRDQQTSSMSLACPPVSLDLTGGFLAWSMSNGVTGSNSVELRFFLSASDIEALERKRHANQADIFQLYLELDPAVAGLRNFNQHKAYQESTPAPSGPWDGTQFGMYAQTFIFWTASIQTILLNVERTTWIERVLPGLGYDRSRLVEVDLPPPLPMHGSSASEFDKAKRAFDERRYSDCVAACRGLIGIWEKSLGVTGQLHIAAVIASRLGWSEADLRRRFLDDLWKSANDLSNVPHHPEGQDVIPQSIEARDARLLFLVVVGLSEYLGTLANGP